MGTSHWPAGFALASMFAGCAGDARPSSPDASADNGAIESACVDWVAAQTACRFLASARGTRERATLACVLQWTLPGTRITAPADLESCADALSADCSASCKLPTTGTLPNGSPCNLGVGGQCESGFCFPQLLAKPGQPSCGVCSAGIPRGEPCDVDASSNCVFGLYCSAAGTCSTYGVAGSPCNTSTTLCGPGLVCNGSSTCDKPRPLGASCSQGADCGPNLSCSAGTCSVGPGTVPVTCGPMIAACPTSPALPGETCGIPGLVGGPPCAIGVCLPTEVCPDVLADGEPCPVDDKETCDIAATCDSSGKCSILGSEVCR